MCFYRPTSSNHFDFTGFLTCGPNQSVTLIVYKVRHERSPGAVKASGPGRSDLFMSPTCSAGRAELDTWSSYALSWSSGAQRSSAALNTRTLPSLAPVAISPLGSAETVHTEMAGCTIVCAHSPSDSHNNATKVQPCRSALGLQ